MNTLPPLNLIKSWREQGLAPKGGPTNGHYKYNPEELFSLYQTMSLQKVGKAKGITGERVRQILQESGYSTRLHAGKGGNRKPIPLDQMIPLREAGASCEAIGKLFNLSTSTVQKHLKSAGVTIKVDTLKPIGCPRCITDPVARGLCNACYVMWLRRGKPDDKSVQPKAIKPIGCEDCNTKPYCKGLCRLCYGRSKYRKNREGL